MTWQQLYDPFNNKLISAAISALPVLTLFFVLVGLKKRVWVAALSGLLMAVALALVVFNMPVLLVTTAAGHGFIFGLLRIAWIVVGSIFLYNVASETGQFQVMKDSIAGLSSDKRLQLVLIAFCFGAFLEGTGGGGAPVAIAGAFLMGLGFRPFQCATLCLLANSAPGAWGGVGHAPRTMGGFGSLPASLIGGYGSTLSSLFGGGYQSVQAGLSLDFNIRNRTADAQLAQTAIAERRLKLERSRAEQGIEAQIRNSIQAIQTARQRINSAQAGEAAAKEKLESETRLFQSGESTNFFVLTRQNEYLDARRRLVIAQLDLNKAVARLEQALGNTLKTHNVTLK